MKNSTRVKIIAISAIILGLFVTFWQVSRPWVFVRGETEMIEAMPARPGLPVRIEFIHSVQKTPVEENLVVGEDVSDIVLKDTRYHSFGVGLPFLESEGSFQQEGNDFVMYDMNRHFQQLSLRTGLGTKLTVTLNGKVHELYKRYDPGHRIDIFIAPRIYILLHQMPETVQKVFL